MGAAKTLKQILIDKETTMTALADSMDKPRQTVANTFFKDSMSVKTTMDYAEALGCELIIRDAETGREYPIYR